MAVGNDAGFVLIEIDTDVVPTVFGNDAGLPVDHDTTADFSRHSVMLFYVFTVHIRIHSQDGPEGYSGQRRTPMRVSFDQEATSPAEKYLNQAMP
jgi:hypothetical protein